MGIEEVVSFNLDVGITEEQCVNRIKDEKIGFISAYDSIEGKIEKVGLSDLEILLLCLNALTRRYVSGRNRWYGIDLKTSDTYLTNDGYPLGSIIWMMFVTVDDFDLRIYGNTPVILVNNALQFWTGVLSLWPASKGKEQRKFIRLFIEAQENKSSSWGRWV